MARSEDLLRELIAELADKNPTCSLRRVLMRMHDRKTELRAVFETIDAGIRSDPGRREVIYQIAYAAPHFSPQRLVDVQRARAELPDLLDQFGDAAARLLKIAESLQRRALQAEVFLPLWLADPLEALSIGVHESDGDKAHLFDGYIQPRLDELQARFDDRYLPTTADLLTAWATVGHRLLEESSDVNPCAGIALLRSPKRSPRDFVRALLSLLADLKRWPLAPRLPRDFAFTAEHLAALADVCLDLPPGATDAQNLKNVKVD